MPGSYRYLITSKLMRYLCEKIGSVIKSLQHQLLKLLITDYKVQNVLLPVLLQSLSGSTLNTR